MIPQTSLPLYLRLSLSLAQDEKQFESSGTPFPSCSRGINIRASGFRLPPPVLGYPKWRRPRQPTCARDTCGR